VDPVEGRGSQMMEPLEGNMAGTQEPGTVSTKQQRIAQINDGCVISYLRHVAKPSSGEPDALVAHVRIYGGPG
jgi:hypothetical protein